MEMHPFSCDTLSKGSF